MPLHKAYDRLATVLVAEYIPGSGVLSIDPQFRPDFIPTENDPVLLLACRPGVIDDYGRIRGSGRTCVFEATSRSGGDLTVSVFGDETDISFPIGSRLVGLIMAEHINERGAGGGPAGSVTTVSVVAANGFSGSVASPTTTPAITVGTSITGLLKGDGTSVAAATPGADYLTPSGNGSLLSGITPGQVGASPVAHDHDGRYYTEGEVDSLLGGKAPSVHTHTVSDIIDLAADPGICRGRLTALSGNPVPNTDVLSAGSVYWVPFGGNLVSLFNGAQWRPRPFSETSVSLASGFSSGKNYDVFAYWSGSSLALETVAWQSDTLRLTNLGLQDGVYVKSGDPTRRYLGTFRTVTSTTTEDSLARRLVWNNSNRVSRPILKAELYPTGMHTYTGTWREWKGGSYRAEIVLGLSEDVVATNIFGGITAGAESSYLGSKWDNNNERDADFALSSSLTFDGNAPYYASLTAGYHFCAVVQYSFGTSTYYEMRLSGIVRG